MKSLFACLSLFIFSILVFFIINMKLFHKNSKSTEEREPLDSNFTYYSNFSERSPLLPRPQFNESDADSDASDIPPAQTPSSSPALEPELSNQNQITLFSDI